MGRLLSSLCFMAVCSVMSAQDDPNAVPNAVELDRVRELIRDTPCPGWTPKPLAVVRAVNRLHSMGKERAISLLREIAPDVNIDGLGTIVTEPDNSARQELELEYPVAYHDDQRVCLLIPLLFEVDRDGVPPPEAWYDKDLRRWRNVAATQAIQGGIPFVICGEWTYGGLPYPTRRLVEWAAAHGRLREKPIEPQDDPLLAAAELFNKIAAGDVSIEEWRLFAGGDDLKKLRDSLREQAISMLPLPLNDRRTMRWEEVTNIVAQSGVRWDRDSQAYVLTGTGNKR